MKKAVFFILMAFGFASYAQTIQSTQVEFNKTKVPGVSLAIAGYDATFIQNALQYRFEKIGGLKGSSSKGFRVYSAQIFPEFGTLSYDIYTIVNKGSKKDQLVTVNLLVSKGNNNFASPNDDTDLTQKMKDFLTNFPTVLKEFERVQNIDKIAASIKTLEKECKSLTSDTDKLKKELSKVENNLKNKEKLLFTKQNELQKAKSEMELLKGNK
jgi:hypothetical protein